MSTLEHVNDLITNHHNILKNKARYQLTTSSFLPKHGRVIHPQTFESEATELEMATSARPPNMSESLGSSHLLACFHFRISSLGP